MRYFGETSQHPTNIPVSGLGGSLPLRPALTGSGGFSHKVLDGLATLSVSPQTSGDVGPVMTSVQLTPKGRRFQRTAYQLKVSSVSVAGQESSQCGSQ